jgi:putative Mn2+ efflux pump MntP
MSQWTLLAVAFGLAMDAFAVSIGVGLALGRVTFRQGFRLAWHFGLFQALMPVLGWLAGRTIEPWIAPVDHWIAFALLAIVGGRMVYGSFRREDEERPRRDPTRGASLIVLSVATSIDALAVGLSLGLLGESVWYPALVIGLVAGGMTVVGLELGKRLGMTFGKRMELVGGLVLIGIGVRIVVDHMTA